MTTMSSRSLRPAFLSRFRASHVRAVIVAIAALLGLPFAHASVQSTTTALAISSTSVPYRTPIILTATVTAGGSPVTAGLVLFCDASAAFCENNSALGFAQLTSPNATAVLKIGSGPLGAHSYKAVFLPNNLYAQSVSNTVTYSVIGTYTSTTSIGATGSVGNYTLSGTVVGIGSLFNGPTGTVSFLDASAGNNILGTQPLGSATLVDAFIQAPNSPFAIGTPTPPGNTETNRSVAIASAYLDGDNNLDVVTGDAFQTISVMLGNGDGSFRPKVNYPGCPQGKAMKILLSDVNRDGNTDVALGCSTGSTGGSIGGLVILLGNGDGTFQTPVEYLSGDVAGMAMGDFNGDGILDFVVTDGTQQDVKIFLGNGNGTFQSGVVALTPINHPHNVIVADLNGDGKDDLAFAVGTAVPSSALSDLYVALGNGDGTFHAATKVASQIGEFLTTGDTNADGIADVVSSTITLSVKIGNNLWVLIGKGDGTFQTPVNYISDIPSDPHLTDVNGDGKTDIIAGGSYGALVYVGNGDGTFQPYNEPVIGGFSLTYAVNAGDYNNDGNADLIGTDAATPRAAVALSEVQQTASAAALTGVAVFPLGSGTHNVDASYSGDARYTTSISNTTAVLAAPTPTTLTLSVVPSSASLAGQSITLTATLSPYTVGPPTTTTNGEAVKFYSGATLVGSGTLSNGVATLTTSTLPVGTNPLKAVFAGDSNYNPSNSGTVSVTVSNILIASSLNPSTYGQAVTFTATVAVAATGTVTFMDGGTALGTSAISGGMATFTTSSLLAATHDITGIYSGDGTHSAATSPDLFQVVNKASPTLTVGTSGASTYGGSVTITATLPTGVTGTVTFTSGGVTVGSGTVSGAGTVAITTSTLPAGSDTITASYGGDGNNNSATGSTTQTVAKATPVLPAPVATPSTPTTANSVTLTETVPSGVSGPVTFYNGATVLGTVPVSGGVATLSLPSLPLGANPITASTPGDSNNNPATSPTTTVTVIKATPTVTVTTSGPSTYGGTVTITAAVPPGTTGTVTISSGGVTLGSGTVNPTTGTVAISTTALPTGTDTITASYGGDANNNPATGTTTQTVSKTTPTVTVTTSGPSTYGGTVTITAAVPPGTTGTVTVTSGGVTLGSGTVDPTTGTVTITTTALPTGTDTITASYGGDVNNNPATGTTTQTVSKTTPTVTVTTSGPSNYGDPVTITTTVPVGTTGTVTVTSGGVTLGSGTVNPTTGTVTITTGSLPAGSNPITAIYGGDTNNNPNSGSTTQTVSKGSPTSTLTSSQNPSTVGSPVTFTDTLPTNVTGTVTFTSGGTVLGTATVTNGVATLTSSTLSAGSDPVTATYSGDANNNGSSASLTQSVNKDTPTLTVTTSGPSTYGGSVTITASLPPGPTGTVTITSGGVTLGTGVVGPTGIVTITTATLPVGSNTITASYSGDTSNNAVTGVTVQTVAKGAPTVTLTSSANPSTTTQPVTFTATLPGNTTGSVTFYDGSTVLGTGTIVNGVATLTVGSLTSGSHTVTASYSGDTNNNAGTSAPLTQVVNKTTPVLPAPGVSSASLNATSPETITEVVPAGVTGPVSFYNGSTLLGTATIVNGVATLTVPSLPIGTDLITATTPADADNNAAVSPATTVTVTKTSPVLDPPVVSTTTAVAGTPVTITEPIPPGVTGPVSIYDGPTLLGTVPVVNGTVTITVTTLPLGPNPITVVTPGTSTTNPATSPVVTVTITKAVATVTLTSSHNPALIGQSVTFTALTTVGTTGTVTFMDGATVLGIGTVNASGLATFTTSSLTAGSHTITAAYGGDTTYGTATSGVLSEVVTKAVSGIALIESSPTELLGTSVTFTATVTTASPTPTGTVTFFDGTTALGTTALSTNGSVVVTLATSGNAAYATSTLTAGSHQITAIFSGDSSFAGSSSAPVTNIVQDFTATTKGVTSQNVFPGDSTSYSFTLTPVGASTFLSNLTLTVTGLPAGANYTFTPATIAAGSGATDVVLNVQTSSTMTAANHGPEGAPGQRRSIPIALGMLGLIGLGAIRRHRNQMPRMLMLLLLCVASLLPVAALTGCAGGYFALTPKTYSITVTGIEGTIQHSATSTLVVQ